jgi:hypothetical protein
MTTKFELNEFLTKLNEGKLNEEKFTQPVEIIGLIRPNELRPGLLFAPNSCDEWFELNSQIIRGIRFIKDVNCGTKQYPLVTILIEPTSIDITTLLKLPEPNSIENKINDEKRDAYWVAICNCGWRGFPTPDMMRAIQEGRQHESFYNDFPMGQRHFTHPELVFGPGW